MRPPADPFARRCGQEEGLVVGGDVRLFHLDELLDLCLREGPRAAQHFRNLLTDSRLQLREAAERGRVEQPAGQGEQLVVDGGQAGETRLKQLPDRPVLRVLQHVLEELDGRDGEGEVVSFAVLGRLDQVLVREGRSGEGRNIAQRGLQRLKRVLDPAARLDVGALLHQRADEVATEGSDQRLRERRLASLVGRHHRPKQRQRALRLLGEHVHLCHDAGEVLLEVLEQHAR
mmetsp:Transcript_44668/g.145143  ORF Transcript_44668/g.145143 Transcript_44668/m.145143 type:complete len:231 (+) Transcript_44668:734-1426(+)